MADGSPRLSDGAEALEGRALIEIPGNIGAWQREKAGLALEWRGATRQTFTRAIASGYVIADFLRQTRNDQPGGAYLLTLGQNS